MTVFELSGQKLGPMPNFSSISLQMADFPLKVLVRKFQLDTLSSFRMVEEKQEGGVFPPPPPGKIGLD